MKREQFRKLIKECIREVMDEVNYDSTKGGKPMFSVGAPNSQKRKITAADPTKEEMMNFLLTQFGREPGWMDEAEEAIYWFANFNHGGQATNLYSILSTSSFQPGPISRGPEKGSMSEMMLDSLEAEYGK